MQETFSKSIDAYNAKLKEKLDDTTYIQQDNDIGFYLDDSVTIVMMSNQWRKVQYLKLMTLPPTVMIHYYYDTLLGATT